MRSETFASEESRFKDEQLDGTCERTKNSRLRRADNEGVGVRSELIGSKGDIGKMQILSQHIDEKRRNER